MFTELERFSSQTALIDVTEDDSGSVVTTRIDYQTLTQAVVQQQSKLLSSFDNTPTEKRPLILLKMHANSQSVIDYLAVLRAGFPCIIVDPDLSSAHLKRLVEAFHPNAIVDRKTVSIQHRSLTEVDRRVAILLPTSGSTGAAKYVALSYENLRANAESIVDYLPIETSDCAMNTLPLFYSYGLSVLNTHLLKGASLVLSPFSVVNKPFWQLLDDLKVTSIAGVPHTYEMLLRLRFTRRALPHLRYLTQAGGKLAIEALEAIKAFAVESGKRFFVMYGQTEATARMAFVDASAESITEGTIGRAIVGGEFDIQNGELCYRGPNVMLGYVSDSSMLGRFEPINWLKTGDLAEFDDEGRVKLVGRKSRFLKLLGFRVDLDAIENSLQEKGIDAYCSGNDQCLVVAVKLSDLEFTQRRKEVRLMISKLVDVHHSIIKLINLSELPLTSNGKKDYPAIIKLALQSN